MSQNIQTQDIVYALAASPGFADDGICFAARASGLHRSEDEGASWHDAYAGLSLVAPLATSAVAVSPNFRQDRTVFAGVAGGVLHSLDGGRSWVMAPLPSALSPVVSSLAISPNYAHDGILLAATVEDGVFRSANRGHNWTAWNFGLLDLNILSTAISPGFGHDDTLFVGSESGVFCSTNGGRAWKEIAGFPPDWAPVLSLALSPDFCRDGTLFAGTESNGLFWSANRGESWEQLAAELAADAVNAVILGPKFPAKPSLLVLVGNRLLVSRDKGMSWTEWETGVSAEADVASVIAPMGLDSGAPLLVGLTQGAVLRI